MLLCVMPHANSSTIGASRASLQRGISQSSQDQHCISSSHLSRMAGHMKTFHSAKWRTTVPPVMQPWQYQAPPQVHVPQGPPPPTVKPPASFPTNTFDMSALHDIVQAEFGSYHAVYNGNVRMGQLCRKSGITLSELQTHPNFKNQSGASTLCYIHVLGGCTNKACTRKHPKKHELGAAFCADLCKQLKAGKEYLINNPVSGGKRAGGPPPGRGRGTGG